MATLRFERLHEQKISGDEDYECKRVSYPGKHHFA